MLKAHDSPLLPGLLGVLSFPRHSSPPVVGKKAQVSAFALQEAVVQSRPGLGLNAKAALAEEAVDLACQSIATAHS